MDRYEITFRSRYMGNNDYTVYDRQTRKEFIICYRNGLPEYNPNLWNYTKEEFDRDVAGSLYLVHNYSGKISEDVFVAFKKFLLNEEAEYRAWAATRIEKYKDDPEIARIYERGPAEPIIRGAAYYDGGWKKLWT